MIRHYLLGLLIVGMCLPSAAWGQQKRGPAKKPVVQRKQAATPQKPVAPKPEEVPSNITAALRLGANIPSSELGAGFLPDLEAGYRIGMGSLGFEPALGFQYWGGDADGEVQSAQLGFGSTQYRQSVSAMALEARLRLWYKLQEIGYPLFGIGLGGVGADAEQESFGVTRSESEGALTWMVQAGYAYPIEDAHGNVELLVGYRGASVDMATTGDANVSGLQLLIGWHAAF